MAPRKEWVPSNAHYRSAFRETVTLATLRQIFLDGWRRRMVKNGRLCNLRYKRVCPGVYEIWFEVGDDEA
jgi:hypothetical protein